VLGFVRHGYGRSPCQPRRHRPHEPVPYALGCQHRDDAAGAGRFWVPLPVQVQRRTTGDVIRLPLHQVAVVAVSDGFQIGHAVDAGASGGAVKPPQMGFPLMLGRVLNRSALLDS
jgi:hypothetical protein